MSVKAALMKAPSKDDVILQGMCREWIWEYLLKHCSNSRLIRALAGAYPLPHNSLHLQRLLLLRSLSFDLKENCFSDRTLETISALLSLYRAQHRPSQFFVPVTSQGTSTRVSFSLQELHLAVRVESTVQYLREDSDNWPKFYEALEKHWVDTAEELEHDDVELKDRFLQLKNELWAVQKQPELRHDLLKQRKRKYMTRMMQSFLSDAWDDVGLVFLEGVAENLKKGLYMPDEFSPNTAPNAKERQDVAENLLPDKSVRASSAKYPNTRMHEPSAEGPILKKSLNVGPSMPPQSSLERPVDLDITKHSSKGAMMPQRSLPERCIDAFTIKEASEGPAMCRITKEQLQESPIDPSNTKVLGNLSGDTDRNLIEQKLRSSSKRRMPETLLEKEKEWTSVKEAQSRVLRSSFLAGRSSFGERDTVVASPLGQKLQTFAASKVPNASLAEAEKTFSTAVTKDRDECEPTCPSPPPWAGSPGVDDTIMAHSKQKRRKLGPFYLDEIDTSKLLFADGSKGNLDTPDILKAQSELKEGQARLNAVVQDPLPEALKIAEEAAKASEFVRQNQKETFSENDRNQGTEPISHKNNNTGQVSPSPLEGGALGYKSKSRNKSIMDRNPTAHTVEWETSDDIADSSDGKSPSRSRQVHLPSIQTRHSFRHRGDISARSQPRRRKITRWTRAEEDVLRKEVARYGKGHWKHILQKHSKIFESRTEVDLKDKWRNIERQEGIL